jgi:cytosine/adenosine deaminase-related metal-dependent hydrolase
VCPGTIEYFARTPPPVPRWLAAGITVALGTDSRASNRSMSMRDELRRAARMWPELPPAALLAMATASGGRALGRPGLGRLCRGGRADFLCVPAGSSPRESILRELVHGERPLLATWLGGVRVAAARSC